MRKNYKNILCILVVMLLGMTVIGCNEILDKAEEEEIIATDADAEIMETEELDEPPLEVETQEIVIPIENEQISLVMVGDMLMHMGVVSSGYMSDGTLNYDHLFAPMKSYFEEADIAIVNQETILGGAELGYSGYPTFNSPDEVGDAIVAAGFNIVLHATNHTMDKGKTGLLNCIAFWKLNYPEMVVLGMNETQEEQDTIYIYEEKGMKIAILNYTYGTNGLPLPSDMPYAVNLLEEELVIKQLEMANELADFVIVLPHWGTEYQHDASSYQEEWCELFLQYGVDLVIGAHPHVIQPIEWYYGENGEEMLVYYSLGNFINATNSYQSGVANRMVGGMADVIIEQDAQTQEVYIKEYGVLPLINHYEYGVGFMSCYPLFEYTDELVARSEAVARDSVFSIEFCEQLAYDVFGEEFMNGRIVRED